MNDKLKGYILVFVAVLAMANVYIFSKAALNKVSIIVFGVYWFSFALLYNIIFIISTKSVKKLFSINKKELSTLILIGILEVSSTILFFSSIKTMHNPAIVSFLANTAPVLITILSVLFLSERFNNKELVGVLLTIAGAFTVSYHPDFKIPQNFLKGMILILSSNLIYAISTVTAKKNIKSLSPQQLSFTRTLFLLITSIIAAIYTKENLIINKTALINISIGSLLGPFLAAIASYSALKYIEASKASLFGSTKSLFVVLTSFMYFGFLPTKIQFIGGVFTIIGLILLSVGKSLPRPRLSNSNNNDEKGNKEKK